LHELVEPTPWHDDVTMVSHEERAAEHPTEQRDERRFGQRRMDLDNVVLRDQACGPIRKGQRDHPPAKPRDGPKSDDPNPVDDLVRC
jgi:hypothetical protein